MYDKIKIQKDKRILKMLSKIQNNIEKTIYTWNEIKNDSNSQSNLQKKETMMIKDNIIKISNLTSPNNTLRNHNSLFTDNNFYSSIYQTNSPTSNDLKKKTTSKFNLHKSRFNQIMNNLERPISSSVTKFPNPKKRENSLFQKEVLSRNSGSIYTTTYEENLLKKINKKFQRSIKNNNEYTMSFNENKLISSCNDSYLNNQLTKISYIDYMNTNFDSNENISNSNINKKVFSGNKYSKEMLIKYKKELISKFKTSNSKLLSENKGIKLLSPENLNHYNEKKINLVKPSLIKVFQQKYFKKKKLN